MYYHFHVPIVLKSGSLDLLEPSGPVQALLYLLPLHQQPFVRVYHIIWHYNYLDYFIINNQCDAALSSLIYYTLRDYMLRVLSTPIIRSTKL